MKLNYKLVSSLLGISKTTYYEWNKEQRNILNLLNIYYSNKELEEFLKYKTVTKFDVINSYTKEKEIGNIVNIIQLHNNIYIDADYFNETGEDIVNNRNEEIIIDNMARFIAFLYKNKKYTNDFNSINLDVQFQAFNKEYPHKNNLELLNELKQMRYMLPNTIVACIEYADNDFLELFENKKISKKIKINDIYNFFIPFIIFKYMGILEKIDARKIFEKYNQFFKDNDYSDGIKMLINDIKSQITKDVKLLEKKKGEKK